MIDSVKTMQPYFNCASLYLCRHLSNLDRQIHCSVTKLLQSIKEFWQSFHHPSSLATKQRSKIHDKTRYVDFRPLHHAAWCGSYYYIDDLVLRFDINERDREQVTPLHCAALGGKLRTVEKLIQGGANISARDMRGQTALYWAAYNGNADVIRLLAKHGANVHEQDLRQKTALRAAAKYGHIAAVLTLLNLGADLQLLDSKKQTSYFVACLQGRKMTARLLQQLGAATEGVNVDGKRASSVMGRASFAVFLRTLFFSGENSHPKQTTQPLEKKISRLQKLHQERSSFLHLLPQDLMPGLNCYVALGDCHASSSG